MLTPQINRLRRDYNEIGYWIQKMKKECRDKEVYSLQKKQQIIESTIEELTLELEERM